MKKIFTLATGLLMAVLVFAADRRPTVTVNSMKNYKIVIDGKAFFGSSRSISIANMRDGRHSIQVFEMVRGFFGRRAQERMVSSSSFRTDRNDVVINIDYRGSIRVKELRGNGRFDRNRDRDWNDRDDRYYRDNDENNDWGNDRDNDRNRDRNYEKDNNRRF